MRASRLLACIALAGCTAVEPEPAPRPSSPPKVEVSGRSMQQLGPQPNAWLAEALRWQQLGGDRALATWVATYPDRAAAICASQDALVAGVQSAFASGPGPSFTRFRAALERARTDRSAWKGALALYGELCAPVEGAELLALQGDDAWPASSTWSDANAFREALARQHVRRGDPLAALDLLRERDRAADPGRESELALLEARVLLLLGLADDARAELETLAEAAPPPARCGALATLAAERARAGELDAARELYERALACDAGPDASRARSDLGLVLLQIGQAERGLAELGRAREAMLRAGDYAGAVRSLRAQSAWYRSHEERDEAVALEDQARALVRERGLLMD